MVGRSEKGETRGGDVTTSGIQSPSRFVMQISVIFYGGDGRGELKTVMSQRGPFQSRGLLRYFAVTQLAEFPVQRRVESDASSRDWYCVNCLLCGFRDAPFSPLVIGGGGAHSAMGTRVFSSNMGKILFSKFEAAEC